MGSIMGSIITGFSLGVIDGFAKVYHPEAFNTVIFINHANRVDDQIDRLVRAAMTMANANEPVALTAPITTENTGPQLVFFEVTMVQGAIFVMFVPAFRRGVVGELGPILKKSL